jgi:hypothetical protein
MEVDIKELKIVKTKIGQVRVTWNEDHGFITIRDDNHYSDGCITTKNLADLIDCLLALQKPILETK